MAAQLAHVHRRPIWSLTRQHRLEDGELTVLGANACVSGVMTRIDLGGRRVLVDCGKPVGLEAHEWRFDEAALEVDAVILTQAHAEHIGSLPRLLAAGFTGPIYGTAATLALAKLVLREGMELEGREEREAQALGRGLVARFRPLPYGVAHDLGGVQCTLRNAGYMTGSASVELTSRASRVICSGDLGHPSSVCRGFDTHWEEGRPVDLVLLECTYGDRDHDMDELEVGGEIERILLDVLSRCGQLVVPVATIGESQRLLHHLFMLVDAGRVPPIPILLDGPLGGSITRDYSELLPLIDESYAQYLTPSADGCGLEPLLAQREREPGQRFSEVPGPMIIVAGEGMCTGGRVVGHLRRLLPLEHSTVLFTGYQAEGTPGRAIQRAATRGGRALLGHEEVKVRAHVESLDALSAHTDRSGLRRWLDAIPDVRRVALHHGEPGAQRAFAHWCG